MNHLLIISILLLVFALPIDAEEKKQGEYLGAIASESPDWFKESFLEFEEDVAEAAAGGRRVMLYFHQPGCPYCAKLMQENFTDEETVTFAKKHFDGISINMWGDREVISVGGLPFSEKTFAAALKVQYTPTLVFLDEQGKVALRLNGYYPVDQFRAALSYVAEKGEKKGSFSEYLLALQTEVNGKLITEDFFQQESRLDQLLGRGGRPLAVFFESKNCESCRIMHHKILTDPPTRKLVSATNSVQLDVHSDQIVTTPDGRKIAVSDWASELGVDYTPSVVFYDIQGEEVMRISAFLKTFHFQSVFAYVLEKAYLQQPSFQRYISARGEKIREAGFDTDIWGYDSAHE
ncbi:MAG: thioredoxin fold domain-containing protein [Gammaproteobacteria bacterium]|nr:thioredoxin fold domain-containing protein [Gammaproteobacteria bacterium]